MSAALHLRVRGLPAPWDGAVLDLLDQDVRHLAGGRGEVTLTLPSPPIAATDPRASQSPVPVDGLRAALGDAWRRGTALTLEVIGLDTETGWVQRLVGARVTRIHAAGPDRLVVRAEHAVAPASFAVFRQEATWSGAEPAAAGR